MSASSTPDHSAVGADEQHVTRRELLSAGHAHVGKRRVAAEAALDEVAHRMAAHLVLVDQPFAQQELDVAVVARALANRALSQLVHAAVADVRPVRSRRLGRGTRRRSRAACGRARRPSPSLTTRSWARASESVKKPCGSNTGVRRLREAFLQRRDRDLRRARAVRVPAHSVDDDQQHGVVVRDYVYSVLVLRPIAGQAQFGMIDAHELPTASVPCRTLEPLERCGGTRMARHPVL